GWSGLSLEADLMPPSLERDLMPPPLEGDLMPPSLEGDLMPPSLEGDFGALRLELRLRLVGGLLVGVLQHRLRRRLDQVLGLLQAETGQLAHHLDDLDLL